MSEELLKHVEALPELDPSAFPPVPKHTNLRIPYGSAMRMYERECLLGIVAFVASLSHKWRPVSIKEFHSILNEEGNGVIPFLKKDILGEAWNLVREGLGEMVRLEGVDYFVPKPDFAKHFPTGHPTP